jgi:hypothetical protein
MEVGEESDKGDGGGEASDHEGSDSDSEDSSGPSGPSEPSVDADTLSARPDRGGVRGRQPPAPLQSWQVTVDGGGAMVEAVVETPAGAASSWPTGNHRHSAHRGTDS